MNDIHLSIIYLFVDAFIMHLCIYYLITHYEYLVIIYNLLIYYVCTYLCID